MEENLNSGKTASENLQQFQESKRELLLIGEQVARLFLSAPPSPLLPEWNLSERDNIFETDKVEESEESSESENDDNQDNSGTTERTVPVESTGLGARDESDPIDQQLVKLRLRIEEMRLHLQQI
jgi:hypothetical protein